MLRSSVWSEEFKRDLESYPIYRSWNRSFSVEDCEACHRRNHPASYGVTLEGPPYDALKVWGGEEMVLQWADVLLISVASILGRRRAKCHWKGYGLQVGTVLSCKNRVISQTSSLQVSLVP